MSTTHWTTKARAKHGTWVRMPHIDSAYGMLSKDGQYIFHAVKHPKGWGLFVYRAEWMHFKSDDTYLLLHGDKVAEDDTDTLRDAKGIAAIFGPRRGGMGMMTTAVVDYYDSLD